MGQMLTIAYRTANVTPTPGGIGFDPLKLYAKQHAKGRSARAKANLTLHPLKHEGRVWHMLERVELELGLSKAAVIDLLCQ